MERLPIWNATGATFLWRFGNVDITQSVNGKDHNHQIGVNDITQGDPDNDGVLYHNQGGLHMLFDYDDQSPDSTPSGTRLVSGSIHVITNSKPNSSTGDPSNDGDGWMRIAQFDVNGYDGSGFIEVMLFINEDGFTWEIDGVGANNPQLTWSNTLTGSVFDSDTFSLSWADYNTYGDTAGGADPIDAGEFGDGAKAILLTDSGSNGEGFVDFDHIRVEEGNVIPEPASLMLLGMAGLLVLRRKN